MSDRPPVTDNARAEEVAEAIRLAPVDDVFPSKDAQAHYRCGFRDGAEWAAGRAETTTATTEDVARVPHRDELAEVVLAATLPHLGPGGQTAPYVKPVHYAMVDALLARFHITERQQ